MDDRMGEGLDPFCEDVTDEDITDRNVTDGDGTEERPVREYVLEDGVLTRADAAEEGKFCKSYSCNNACERAYRTGSL